ncbi:hypothetical protein BST61_g579 [Cercospora zeina]
MHNKTESPLRTPADESLCQDQTASLLPQTPRSRGAKVTLAMVATSTRTHPPTLDGLPTELKLLVFSCLPMQTLARCRSLNRNFKNFVDHSNNTEELARSRISARLGALARIQEAVIRDVSYSPLLDALKIFTEHRGIQQDEKDRHDDAMAFAALRLANMGDYNPQDFANMTNLVQQFMYLHFFHYAPHLLGKMGHIEVDMAEFMELAEKRGESLGFDRMEIRRIAAIVSRTPGGFIHATADRKSRGEEGGFPRIPLTPLRCTGATEVRQARLKGFCTMLEIVKLLDVPHLGDTAIFSYYTDSYGIYHLFQASIYGRELGLVDRAALLEEISIY